MRIRITHETIYSYDEPITYAIETLRLTPRNHDGQFVCHWRLDIDADCRLYRQEDPFGSITHTFTIDGPLETLRIVASGEVETEDQNGFVRNTLEPLPPRFYLRGTDLTLANGTMRDFATTLRAGEGGDMLATLHALMGAVHDLMRFDVDAPPTNAAQAFADRYGGARELAHIFIACARALQVPARYVSGYVYRADDAQAGYHGWAEVHLPQFGWLGFDPVYNLCPTDQHVRLATSLDYLGAAPIRGVQMGGSGEQLQIGVRVEPAVRQLRPVPRGLPEEALMTQLSLKNTAISLEI